MHKPLLQQKNLCSKVMGSLRKTNAAYVADVAICPAKSMRANFSDSGVTV
jgi:hypothetical protein